MYEIIRQTNQIRRISDQYIITPDDPVAFQEYETYIRNGGEIFYTDQLTVPATISNAAARTVLINRGLFDTANNLISAMTGDLGLKTRTYWEYSAVFERTSPMILDMGSSLNLTETDLDNLFIEAASL